MNKDFHSHLWQNLLVINVLSSLKGNCLVYRKFVEYK